MLSRRLHENVLSAYGFRRISMTSQPPNPSIVKGNQVNTRPSNKNNVDKSL